MSDFTPPPAAHRHIVLPAEYYESPQTTRIFPRWLPIGCGTASVVFLLIFFAAGALISGGGGGRLLDTMFGKLQKEIDGQFTKDVTPAQRKAFDAEMDGVRARLRASKMKLEKLQPLVRTIQDASEDGHVTPDEANKLTAAAHEAATK